MRALISVSDKTGIIEFASGLAGLGFEIVSTGGTEKALKEAGIDVINISDITGFPECLDGRVKTLHPAVHAGLLAKRSEKAHMERIAELGIGTIDVVVVNLYPFKETVSKPGCTREDAIENIDIGGPTMLRSAAKNYKDVSVVVDPADYELLISSLKAGKVPEEVNLYFSRKVFEHTAAYDALIAAYLRGLTGGGFPQKLTLTYELADKMRYGENPHQSAAFYKEPITVSGALTEAKQLNGKQLSFNNINDANGALELLKEFDEPAVVAVKHASPCGVGSADTVYEAYMKAYNADSTSIFGGIVAVNREIDDKTAEEMSKIFLEIIIAPSYTNGALETLSQKKNLRVLELASISKKRPENAIDIKKVTGGLLVQGIDDCLLDESELKCVTDEKPTEAEMKDLLFAWKLVKYVKSNGITIAKNGQSVGMAGGQVNRIWACKQAIEHGTEFLGADAVKGAALASDAFFPKEDCVQAAADAGITAIIQPGGSVNDQKSIDECNKHRIAMVFTGVRHFRH